MQAKIGFIGTGNMAGALVNGLKSRDDLQLFGHDLDTQKLQELAEQSSLMPKDSLEDLAESCNYLVLGVKPQQLQSLLRELGPLLNSEHCLVSIAAGVTREKIIHLSGGGCSVVRVMPNTPALVGSGLFALCLDDPSLGQEQRELLESIFNTLGQVHILEEKEFDAFTALAGSGPAYVFYFMEALIDAGVSMGLKRQESSDIVHKLLSGSSKLADQAPQSIHELREMVCSPGGTAITALNHLDRSAARGSIIDAIVRAFERSKQLG
jgi:pyrroline-5-carboxylate reductase